jgi:hypothetical protein
MTTRHYLAYTTLLATIFTLTSCLNLENPPRVTKDNPTAKLPESKAERKTIDVGIKPESVCRGFNGKLYITMIGGDEPGDGAVYVLDGDTAKPFATGLNNPKGIAFVKGALITSDETQVMKINGKGKISILAKAEDFPAKVEFLNDVAASRSRDAVYVTEMSHPKRMFDPDADRELWPLTITDDPQANLPNTGCVYKITLEGKVSVAVPPGDKRMPAPNGVTVAGGKDKTFLAMADFFTGNLLAYENGKLRIMAKNLIRGGDAIELNNGIAYVSSWTQGKVIAYNRKERKSTTLIDGLTSAADFYLDRKANQLVIPDMLEGKLHFLPLE